MKKVYKKCPYCDGRFWSGEMCPNCYHKHDKVHELWLLCQRIKRQAEIERRKVQSDDR